MDQDHTAQHLHHHNANVLLASLPRGTALQGASEGSL